MLPQQETLAARLQSRFDALPPERVDAILLHFAGEMTEAEAKAACPLANKQADWFGGVYGAIHRDPKACTWRLFHWGSEDAKTLQQFRRLAIDAGECVGSWAKQFGVQQATLDCNFPQTRWLNVLFDIALDSPRDPRFPMPADWHYFTNVAMFMLQGKTNVAPQEQLDELNDEYRSLQSLGYWAYLQDVVMASVYAIDVLTQEPPIATHTEPATTRTEPQLEGDANKFANLDKLQPSHRKAYLSFAYSEAKNERRLQDRDAYEWLEENGVDAEVGELVDYSLPKYDHWVRYLRTLAMRPASKSTRHERSETRPVEANRIKPDRYKVFCGKYSSMQVATAA